MTRHIAEAAEEFAARSWAVRVLVPASPGADFLTKALARTARARVEVGPISYKTIRSALTQDRPRFARLFTGAFPPDTRNAQALLRAGLGIATPLIESLHLLPKRVRTKAAQRAFYACRPKRRYRVLVLNDATERAVREHAAGLRRVVSRIDNGVRLPLDARPLLDPTNRVRIVSFSRLDESQKDHRTLLEAFAMAMRAGLHAELLILGDGPDAATLRQHAQSLGLAAPMVRFMAQPPDLFGIVASCDIAVLSTRREGLPRVAVEAAALGLPVIASDAPGCELAVDHGKTGLLVSPGSAEALRDAIVSLCGDPCARKAMGSAGKAHAARYDMKRHIDALLRIASDMA